MSAPENAIPLSEENPEWTGCDLPSFTCTCCEYEGEGHELLCVEDNDTLWCPICGSVDWIWD